MLKIRELELLPDNAALDTLPEGKLLINTVNAHSFVTAQQDAAFADALRRSDVLLPDGISIIWACKFLKMKNSPREKIAGTDLFRHHMARLEAKGGGTCMFMGSSEEVLARIRARAAEEYPHIRVVTYSPPYKSEFTEADDAAILAAIHAADPDLLWIGMTAPKQEKWLVRNWERLDIHCHAGAIGAVFDFFAGTVNRAPQWWLDHNVEWLYRLIKEPGRMWRRNVISGPKFLWLSFLERLRLR